MSGAEPAAQPASSVLGKPGIKLARRITATNSVALRAALCVVNAFRLMIKLAWLQWSFGAEISAMRKRRFEVIAKTWCFGKERPAGLQDFYFGDLQSRLVQHNIRTLYLCGDANNIGWKCFARSQVSVDFFRLPELCMVPIFAPVKVAADQLWSALRLRKRSYDHSASPIIRMAAYQASLDCLNPAVTQDSLYYYIAKRCVQQWKPTAFITLYEGHGWEKIAWRGVKAAQTSCKTVGYQHTVLFPETLSMLTPSPVPVAEAVPDIVLALGEHTRELLDASHRPFRSHVIRFGTFRHRGPAAANVADPERRTVLVLPEGIPSETEILFRFAYLCAQKLPDHTFVLRAHPQWPAAKALDTLKEPIRSQSNIIISDNTRIDDDFQRSSAILYRGSSSVLYAILNGLLPIRVRFGGILDSDPVYKLDFWRRVCGDPDDFAYLMKTFENQTSENRQAEWRKALQYVNDYLVSVDDASIQSVVDAVGMQEAPA
jgi:hypothetical protein